MGSILVYQHMRNVCACIIFTPQQSIDWGRGMFGGKDIPGTSIYNSFHLTFFNYNCTLTDDRGIVVLYSTIILLYLKVSAQETVQSVASRQSSTKGVVHQQTRRNKGGPGSSTIFFGEPLFCRSVDVSVARSAAYLFFMSTLDRRHSMST